MRTTTGGTQSVIHWTLTFQLHDLHFADDIALLFHSHHHAQAKVQSLDSDTRSVGLNIKRSETKVKRINNANNNPMLDTTALEYVESFT